MNWHYDNPIVNGEYLCCIQDYSFPFPLYWEKEEGGWGRWCDNWNSWDQFDNSLVVCYTSFQEIPMPEGW